METKKITLSDVKVGYQVKDNEGTVCQIVSIVDGIAKAKLLDDKLQLTEDPKFNYGGELTEFEIPINHPYVAMVEGDLVGIVES